MFHSRHADRALFLNKATISAALASPDTCLPELSRCRFVFTNGEADFALSAAAACEHSIALSADRDIATALACLSVQDDDTPASAAANDSAGDAGTAGNPPAGARVGCFLRLCQGGVVRALIPATSKQLKKRHLDTAEAAQKRLDKRADLIKAAEQVSGAILLFL